MVNFHARNRVKGSDHRVNSPHRKNAGWITPSVPAHTAVTSKLTKTSVSGTSSSDSFKPASSVTFSFECYLLNTIAESASLRRSSGANISEHVHLSACPSDPTASLPSDARRASVYARNPTRAPSTPSSTTLDVAAATSPCAHSPSPAPSTSSSTTYVGGSAPPSNQAAASAETIKRLKGHHIHVIFPREHAEYIAPHLSLPGMPLSHTLSHASPCLFQTTLSYWVPFCTYAENRATWHLLVSTIRSMMSDCFKGVPKRYRVCVADKLVSPEAYTAYLEVYGLSVPQDKSPFKTFYSVIRTIMLAHGRDAMYRWVYTFGRYLAAQELHRLRVLRALPEDLLAQVLVPLPEGWAPPFECMMLELDQPFIMGPMAGSDRQKTMWGRAPHLYRYKHFIGDNFDELIDGGVD